MSPSITFDVLTLLRFSGEKLAKAQVLQGVGESFINLLLSYQNKQANKPMNRLPTHLSPLEVAMTPTLCAKNKHLALIMSFMSVALHC